MDNWGCEFIEDQSSAIEPPPKPRESEFFAMPMQLMHELVDERYQREIAIKDKEQLHAMTVSIAKIGIVKPAIIHYSENLIRLWDGNHRYYCAKKLGLETFPVQFVYVPKMQNKTGTTLLRAFNLLLSQLPAS